MLKLVVNNQNCDLGSNPKITINEESPIFNTSSLTGTSGFPFNLPATPLNLKIFEFPNRITKSEYPGKDFDFKLFHFGRLIADGIITIRQTTEKWINAYLKIGSGSFFSQIKNKKLTDCQFGGERTFVKKTEYTYPTDDFTLFPILNGQQFDETKFEDAFQSGFNRINAFYDDEFKTELDDPGDIFAIIPFPFLTYVIKTILIQYGFKVTENVFDTDIDLRSLVFYNTRDIFINEITYDYEYVEIVLIGRPNIFVWMWTGTVTRELDTFDLKDNLPEMLISDFIISLQNTFNVVLLFDGDNNVKIKFKEDIIKQPAISDISENIINEGELIINEKPDGFKFSWELDNEDDITDFPYFQPIDDVLDKLGEPLALNADVDSITDPQEYEIRYVIESDWYLIYAPDPSVEESYYFTWQVFSYVGVQNYFIDNYQEEIKSKFSTLFQDLDYSYNPGQNVKLPFSNQPGNNDIREDYAAFSPRFLLYRGLQKDSNNDDYPMGGCLDVNDYDGVKIPEANLNMRWDGEYGLYNKYWKGFLYWWMNRKLVKWMVKDPSKLEFDKIYTIGDSNYILISKPPVFASKLVEPSICEFYTV